MKVWNDKYMYRDYVFVVSPSKYMFYVGFEIAVLRQF